MVTVIGILINGIRPVVCGLQTYMYHLQVIVQLAWFSFVTHLAALSFLRNYFANQRRELYILFLFDGLPRRAADGRRRPHGSL